MKHHATAGRDERLGHCHISSPEACLAKAHSGTAKILQLADAYHSTLRRGKVVHPPLLLHSQQQPAAASMMSAQLSTTSHGDMRMVP